MKIEVKQELAQILEENVVHCHEIGNTVILQFTSDENDGKPLAVRASNIAMIEVRSVFNRDTQQDEERAVLRYNGYAYNVRETYRTALAMWLAAMRPVN